MRMNKIENYVLPFGKSLGLCVVYEDGKPEHHKAPIDFRWNLELGGSTEDPDWDPGFDVGGGLHVWEWAQGCLDLSLIWFRVDVVWLTVEYDATSAMHLNGRIKVPECRTIAISSDRKEVASFINSHCPKEYLEGPLLFAGREIVEVDKGRAHVGDYGTVIVRGKGLAQAGYKGKAIVGDEGEAYAGDYGYAVAGDGGIAEVGDWGRVEVGDGGIAIVGHGGTAIAGGGGTATAGDDGTARAGSKGTAIVGKRGRAVVKSNGRAQAGPFGRIIFVTDSLREYMYHIEMDDDDPCPLKPDTLYKFDEHTQQIVEA